MFDLREHLVAHDEIEGVVSEAQLNGKVERSHRSDEQDFYQLLSYKGDIDPNAKLAEWERFYNLARPHGAHNGKTPYETLCEKLRLLPAVSRQIAQATHEDTNPRKTQGLSAC